MPTATRSAAGSKAPAPRPRVGTTKLKSSRLLACMVVAATTLLAPAAADASSSQLSLIQDDRELLGGTGESPDAAMVELRGLGVDIVRTNVIYEKIYRTPTDRRKPAGFSPSDPGSPRYDWSATDRLVEAAKQNGIQVMMTVTGPGPFFSSSSPSRCRRQPCTYRPSPSEFAGFAAAVAKRYRGRVAYWSIWNEPNIGKTWLSPRFQRTRHGRVDVAGALYRKLFIAGQRSIARYDPARRNRVLFGEVAAITQPLPMLRAALCLDPRGRPFKGRLRALHGCSGRVRRLNIGGFAVHPYNQSGGGRQGPRTSTKTKTSLPIAYMPRLHRLMDGAARRGRIGRGKGIYVTEFGFQSNPPDRVSGVSLGAQAQFINESDRLLFSDRRVKTVAQYELTDVPEQDQFNTGLRFVRSRGGQQKPSYGAYRLPIVVTRRSSSLVEVYGQVRPRRMSPGLRPQVQVQQGGSYVTVATPRLSSRGFFRINVRRSGASRARWRIVWGAFQSRTATPIRPLRYRRG